MSASNGTDRLSVLELGDLTPDVRMVRAVKDGRASVIEAYAEGPTCPGRVKARVAKSVSRYQSAVWSDGPPDEETGQPTRIYTDDPEAWADHLRDLLMAIMPDLGFESADVLAGNQARALELLEELGWREREPVAGERDPNGPGEAPTTAGSSRGSRRSTGSRRKRS